MYGLQLPSQFDMGSHNMQCRAITDRTFTQWPPSFRTEGAREQGNNIVSSSLPHIILINLLKVVSLLSPSFIPHLHQVNCFLHPPFHHRHQVYCYHHQYTMKPISLSAVIFGFGVSAAVLERAPGQCCFNINAYGGGRGIGRFYGWKSPIWQGVEGAFHLSSSDGDYKKPSEFCFSLQDRSFTDSSGRKCHVQKETGQLRCLHNPLGRRSSVLLSVQNQQAANTK